MQNKIQKAVLPVLLTLLGLAFVLGNTAWSGAAHASTILIGIDKPGAAQTFENGDPDVPSNPIQQKRLGIAGPSDAARPTSFGRTWFGHDNVWLRITLSRWFSR